MNLRNFMNRWFSNDASITIASRLKERQSTYSTLKELQVQTAQTVHELGLSRNNFGNVVLAVSGKINEDPRTVLDYMRVDHIVLKILEKSEIWIVSFRCDWEPEHGVAWIVKDGQPIYVGSDPYSISDDVLSQWDTLHTNSH